MLGLSIVAGIVLLGPAPEDSRQATGVKVGEVSPTSALVWARLTANARPNAEGPDPTGVVRGRQAPPPVADPDRLRRAVPGTPGRARIRFGTDENLADARSTEWAEVDASTDFARSFRLDGLEPATRYHFASETTGPGGTPVHAPMRGTFATAPRPEQPADVRFAVMTCQAYKDRDDPDGFLIYDAMARRKVDFYAAAGDLVYYDTEAPRATTIPLARHHWHRMYGLPKLVEMHRSIPGYFMKDDHDTYFDDSYPGHVVPGMNPLTFRDGQKIFLEQNPVGDELYRTFRWGKDLQIWLVEGRDFRTPNPQPDGPDKSIWGEAQKRWLKETLLASDATWKILISPTPLVGPDRVKKGDNHANATYMTEGREIRDWIKANLTDNLLVVCGDRHWQYHSVHPETGLHEFGCGPASDAHASGSPGYDPAIHKFHRQKGGFLEVSVDRQGGVPGVTVEHRDVRGEVVHRFHRAQGQEDTYLHRGDFP